MEEIITPEFKTYLNRVIAEHNYTDFDKNILCELVNSLDNNGYFRHETDFFVHKLKHNHPNISTHKLEDLIKKLQLVTPFGFGATNLQECLILQIKTANSFPNEFCNESQERAIDILENHFNSFKEGMAKKSFELFNEVYSDELLTNKALRLILRLDPKPNSALSKHN